MMLIDKVDWAAISALVATQQHNRERHAPVISTYRWWARRPHRVMAAILDSAIAVYGRDRLRISDPFSGGGTVVFEAARRGLPVYAQDLYPWPTHCLAYGLKPTKPETLTKGAAMLLAHLEAFRAWYQTGPNKDSRELTHILRVRVGSCPYCSHTIHLYPSPFLSMASRSVHESEAFWGCRACGYVHRGSKRLVRLRCPACGTHHEADSQTGSASEHRKGTLACPACSRTVEIRSMLAGMPVWRPFLVQEVDLSRKPFLTRLRTVRESDPVDDVPCSPAESVLRAPIPRGVETNRLLDMGFVHWGDLYPHRQTQILLEGLRFLDQLDMPSATKDRLAIAVIGAAEMAGYLCRWDRYHPKVFEALANHRYAHTTIAVEANLLSPVGRGTLPRRLTAAGRALTWLAQEFQSWPTVRLTDATSKRRRIGKGVVVATGTSTRQLPSSGQVNVVLTDPPYYDDVQYGELSRLFHLWLAQYKQVPPPQEELEAVPNSIRGVKGSDYGDRIAQCLIETRRTLAPGGSLVLTFHNRKMRAWHGLCSALIRAGFSVTGLAVVRAENSADHTKRDNRGLLHDLVLECTSTDSNDHGTPFVAGDATSEEERNLLAIGLALAEAVRQGDASKLGALYEASAAEANVTRLISGHVD